MDIIDYELKRFDTMKNDLEIRKNPESKSKDTSKSSDFLDTIMNEEKPKDVCTLVFSDILSTGVYQFFFRWNLHDDEFPNLNSVLSP